MPCYELLLIICSRGTDSALLHATKQENNHDSLSIIDDELM